MGLPPEAATWREDRPGWGDSEELQAQIIEQLDHLRRLTYVFTRASLKGRLPEYERVISHPDRAGGQKENVTADLSDLVRFIQSTS